MLSIFLFRMVAMTKVKSNQGQKSDDVEYEVIMRVGLSRS